MQTVKKLLALVPLLVLWAMLSVFLWGFVFNLITDCPAEQKITLCVDAETPGATALAVALEEALGDAVRMAKVRPFDYAMFDTGVLTGADLFIVPASHVAEYADWFMPLPADLAGEGALALDGIPFGLLAYNAQTGRGVAADCILYAPPERAAENYYLFFGKRSVHIEDGAAVAAAQALLVTQ